MADDWHREYVNQRLNDNRKTDIYKTLHFIKTLSLPDDVLDHMRLQVKLDEMQRTQKTRWGGVIKQIGVASHYRQGMYYKLLPDKRTLSDEDTYTKSSK